MYPERRLSMEKIVSSLPAKPVRIALVNLPNTLIDTLKITSYSITPDAIDSSHLGWLRPGDPRSELVLSLFKEGNGLPLLLNGIRPSDGKAWSTPPPPQLIAAISPNSQLRLGSYTTPTFLIHSTGDEIVPYHTAAAFSNTMREMGVRGGLATVKGARHIHDLKTKEGDQAWWNDVGIGYDFLFKELGL